VLLGCLPGGDALLDRHPLIGFPPSRVLVSSPTSLSLKPCLRSCREHPTCIRSAGETPKQDTQIRKSTLSGAVTAASGAAHAPWLKPHKPVGTGPTTSRRHRTAANASEA
jgi:hypothetical protein